MKVICSKDELIKGMQMVQPVVSNKVTLPVLSNFLFETETFSFRNKASRGQAFLAYGRRGFCLLTKQDRIAEGNRIRTVLSYFL